MKRRKLRGPGFGKFDLKISSNIQIRFGVPWLDEWFSMALDDEKLGETFLRFPFIIFIGFRFMFPAPNISLPDTNEQLYSSRPQ